jgi:hypothetical protein
LKACPSSTFTFEQLSSLSSLSLLDGLRRDDRPTPLRDDDRLRDDDDPVGETDRRWLCSLPPPVLVVSLLLPLSVLDNLPRDDCDGRGVLGSISLDTLADLRRPPLPPPLRLLERRRSPRGSPRLLPIPFRSTLRSAGSVLANGSSALSAEMLLRDAENLRCSRRFVPVRYEFDDGAELLPTAWAVMICRSMDSAFSPLFSSPFTVMLFFGEVGGRLLLEPDDNFFLIASRLLKLAWTSSNDSSKASCRCKLMIALSSSNVTSLPSPVEAFSA